MKKMFRKSIFKQNLNILENNLRCSCTMYEFQEPLSAQYFQGVKWVSLKQIKTTFLEAESPTSNCSSSFTFFHTLFPVCCF